MKIHFFSFLTTVLFLTSCSPRYTYFTEDLNKKQNWSQEDLMRIQFYVSKDILLTRAIDAGETSITEGKIRIKNGRKVEQVLIKAGTPGVLVLMPKEDRFAISFEESDNEAYLMFGPNPKNFDRFALLAQDWNRENGKVHYRDKVYDVDSASAYASLMVDLRKVGENQYETHRAQGRTIKN
jgi:hypothetical protein